MKNFAFFDYENEVTWIDALVKAWQRLGKLSLQNRGFFSVALAGGKTPQPFYEALTKMEWDWNNTHLFFGDERNVPPDHPESNYLMVKKALLDRISIPKTHVHRWCTELGLEAAAEAYEKELKCYLGESPHLDLAILGVGTDGHTASIFPDTEAVFEGRRLAMANRVKALDTTRFTLTYPILNTSREAWFLVYGEEKKAILDKLRDLESHYPVSKIRPVNAKFFYTYYSK